MKKLKFMLLTGDITYNRGDRGILASMIDLLNEKYPGCDIVYDSYLPKRDEPWYHPARVIGRGVKAFFSQIYHLATADVVLWGGGGLLTDNASRIKAPYWFVKILFTKWILRRKVMAFALGVIIRTKMGAFFSRITLNAIDCVVVRDKNSFENLKEIGVNPKKLYSTADPATLLNAENLESGAKILSEMGVPLAGNAPLIAIPLSFCSFQYNPNAIIPRMFSVSWGLKKEEETEQVKQIITQFARLCDWLIENLKAQVILIPTYDAPWEKDDIYLMRIREEAKHALNVFVLHENYPPKQHVAMFKNFDLVISVPMHHNVFSLVAGTPCYNIYYEPKGRDFYLSLGAESLMSSITEFVTEGGFRETTGKIQAFLAQQETLWPQVLARFEKVKTHAARTMNYLDEIVSKL